MSDMCNTSSATRKLLESSLSLAKISRHITDRILEIDDYCGNYKETRKLMYEASDSLQQLNTDIRVLYQTFNPLDYTCSGEAHIGLLRLLVTSDFVKRLYLQLLSIDFCQSTEDLKFFLDTMRRISFDVDILLNKTILINHTYVKNDSYPQHDSIKNRFKKTVYNNKKICTLSSELLLLGKEIENNLNAMYRNDTIAETDPLDSTTLDITQDLLLDLKVTLLDLSSLFTCYNSCSTTLQIKRWLIDAETRVNTVIYILYQIAVLKSSTNPSLLCQGELNFTSALLSFDLIYADLISINTLIQHSYKPCEGGLIS